MPWRRIVKEVRPNTDVSFYVASEDARDYVASTYEATGKSTSFVITYSNDNLTKFKTRVFNNESSRNEFVADSSVRAIGTAHAAHCSSNNTTKTIVEDREI